MADPKLAEVINPRLAMQRRMEAEGQSPPALPDVKTASNVQFFNSQPQSAEEKLRKQRALADMLRRRDAP